jgi:RNA polymerase sigma factor (sigma-70 family)
MRDEDFERLYEEHSQPLFGFLVYRTGNRALAEDVLSEAFERVLRARRRFDPGKASEKTWLYSIALNCLRDQGRRKAAEGRALERAGERGGNAPDPPDLESRDELYRALDVLGPGERELIALRYGADLTVPEIAKVTNERLTTVEARIYRALRKLREELS